MNPSLVDYLNSSGQDSSLSARAKLAYDHGLVSSANEYMTLASQGKNADVNTRLLGSLKTLTPPKSQVPVTPPASTISGAANYGTNIMTGSQIEKGTSLPEPSTFISATPTKTLSDMVSEVAGRTMNSNQVEIDNLRKQLEQINATDIANKKEEVANMKNGMVSFANGTPAEDALKANNEKFQVEQNIQLYSDIQQRIVDAQEALNMGLIYEADRPARMKFITGSEATLQKQGLATIGALQGTAAVIKGNLDLAKAYGEATVNAINSDNEMSFKALSTLLDLSEKELIDLTDNDRKLINSRLTAIETEANKIQTNKNDVLDLMTKYPKAFAAGGVTLLDSKEQALQKMLPTMANDEKLKFQADIAAKNKESVTATTEAKKQQYTAQLLAMKEKGMKYDEAVLAFADVLSVDDIAKIYGQKATGSSPQDVITDSYYSQFIDPATGKVKTGTDVKIDPSNGRPIVSKASASTGLWSKIKGISFN